MPLRLKDLVLNAKANIKEVACGKVEHLKCQGYKTLDVREASEYLDGTIPMSLHIPRGLLEPKCDMCFDGHQSELSNLDQPWIIFCQAGGRGALAAHTMQLMGYTNVVNLAGGFNAWKAFGGAVSTPPTEDGLIPVTTLGTQVTSNKRLKSLLDLKPSAPASVWLTKPRK